MASEIELNPSEVVIKTGVRTRIKLVDGENVILVDLTPTGIWCEQKTPTLKRIGIDFESPNGEPLKFTGTQG